MTNPNIKPKFKKGDKLASEAGKKSKRPKTFKTIIDDILKENDKVKGKLSLENIMKSMMVNGLKGSTGMMQQFLDRYFGKVKEEIDIKQETVIIRSDTESKYMLGDK